MELEASIRDVAGEIDAARPRESLHPLRGLDERMTARLAEDGELRAAMFRFVDVAPACDSRRELGRHLTEHLEHVEHPPLPVRTALRMGRSAFALPVLGAAAKIAVERTAHRFIVGRSPIDALPVLRGLWKRGVGSSLDLLGEATLTSAEADAYAERCAGALRALAEGSARWPEQPRLEADTLGPIPRPNLSVKLTGLTPLIRPAAPERGERDAEPRLRELLRIARDVGAHLHVDMESLDTREITLDLVLALLSEREFASGPSAGVVVQSYLRDCERDLERILSWAREQRRSSPLVVRLVKGAYWDHEVASARQQGWKEPVHTSKGDCDASFERSTRALLEARPLVRVAIASHNLRSLSYAIACNRAFGAGDAELELQVLRGLGDDLQHALAKLGFRVRTYCPVGELVEGMAYLVRRLLENTSNESFLHRRAVGERLEELLAAP